MFAEGNEATRQLPSKPETIRERYAEGSCCAKVSTRARSPRIRIPVQIPAPVWQADQRFDRPETDNSKLSGKLPNHRQYIFTNRTEWIQAVKGFSSQNPKTEQIIQNRASEQETVYAVKQASVTKENGS